VRAIVALFWLVAVAGGALGQETRSWPAAPGRLTGEEACENPSELKLALDVTIVTTVSVEALKRTFKQERPVGSGYAFPSGHAALSFALAEVAARHHPRQRTLWYLIAARVAWSRVKVRAHDWEDVIAGAALGQYVGRQAVTHGGIVLARVKW